MFETTKGINVEDIDDDENKGGKCSKLSEMARTWISSFFLNSPT
jgi:hypothetical protein